MGFLKCRSKPASVARWRSSLWPQPLTATRNNCPAPGFAADSPGDFVAVEDGHADVEQGHVRTPGGHGLQGFLAVGSLADFMAADFEQECETFQRVRIVVRDQHAQCLRLSRCRRRVIEGGDRRRGWRTTAGGR